jgi:hypothetical protein
MAMRLRTRALVIGRVFRGSPDVALGDPGRAGPRTIDPWLDRLHALALRRTAQRAILSDGERDGIWRLSRRDSPLTREEQS